MIQCNVCGEWYHSECVKSSLEGGKWTMAMSQVCEVIAHFLYSVCAEG